MPLICPACDKEIIPGSQVRMVIPSEEEDGERRIFTDDEIIAYHEACPTEES